MREALERGTGTHRRGQVPVGECSAGGHPTGDLALCQSEIDAADSGDLARGEYRRHAGLLVVVHFDEPIGGQGAACRDGQLQSRGESVPQAHRIALDGALGADNGTPVPVKPGHGG